MSRAYRRIGLYRPMGAGIDVNFCDIHFRYHTNLRDGLPIWFGGDGRSIRQIKHSNKKFWQTKREMEGLIGEMKVAPELELNGGFGTFQIEKTTKGHEYWVCILHGPIYFDNVIYQELRVYLHGQFQKTRHLQDAEMTGTTDNPDELHFVLPYGTVKWDVEVPEKWLSRSETKKMRG